MDYNLFWVKHINKPDVSEIGVKTIITTKTGKKLKKSAAIAASKVMGTAIDFKAVESKAIPLGVEVSTEFCKDLDGHEVSCVPEV